MTDTVKKLPLALTLFKYSAATLGIIYLGVKGSEFWNNKVMAVKQNTHLLRHTPADSTEENTQMVQFTTTNPEPTPN